METQGYFLLIPFVLNLFLAVFLICRGEKAYKPINRSFSLWVFSICFWYLQLINQTIKISDDVLPLLFRVSLIGQWLIPSAFLYFVFCFTHEKINISKKLILIIPALFFIVLILVDSFGFKIVINAIRYNIYGDMGRSVVYKFYPLMGWLAYFFIYIIWGITLITAHLWRITVVFHDLELKHIKSQSNFLLAVLAIVIFIIGLVVDIVVPIFKPLLFPVSSVTTSAMVVFVSLLLLRVER